jgi:hypothetical protein
MFESHPAILLTSLNDFVADPRDSPIHVSAKISS